MDNAAQHREIHVGLVLWLQAEDAHVVATISCSCLIVVILKLLLICSAAQMQQQRFGSRQTRNGCAEPSSQLCCCSDALGVLGGARGVWIHSAALPRTERSPTSLCFVFLSQERCELKLSSPNIV